MRKAWYAGALVLVLAVGVGVLGYADGHADQNMNSGWSAQTFTQTPLLSVAGTGAAVPPNIVYSVDVPLLDHLTVDLRSDSFTWVPDPVPGRAAGSAKPAAVSLTRYSGGCPGAAAPGMVCPAQWQARYDLSTPGVTTIHWTLLALAPPTAETGLDSQAPSPPPVSGSACPAHLPVPLTPAVEGCVVATATIAATVSSTPET